MKIFAHHLRAQTGVPVLKILWVRYWLTPLEIAFSMLFWLKRLFRGCFTIGANQCCFFNGFFDAFLLFERFKTDVFRKSF